MNDAPSFVDMTDAFRKWVEIGYGRKYFLTEFSHVVKVQHRKQPASRLYNNESIHKRGFTIQ